jgi:hypothetical protein
MNIKRILAIVLTAATMPVIVGCSKDNAIDNNIELSDESSSVDSQLEEIELMNVSTKFSFVNMTTGILDYKTVYEVTEKLKQENEIDVLDLSFSNIKHDNINNYNTMYKLSIVNSTDVAINNESLQYELELSTNEKEKYTLQFGSSEELTEQEAKAYAPNGSQLTFIGVASMNSDGTKATFKPIFVGLDNVGCYTVKSNLYTLGLKSDGMCDILTAIGLNNTINEKATDETENKTDIKKSSITDSGITITLTSTSGGVINGIFKNENDFGVWIDNGKCTVNGTEISEPFLRAEAGSEIEFNCLYGDEFKKGDIITIKGKIKNTDTSFSVLGDFNMVFEIK